MATFNDSFYSDLEELSSDNVVGDLHINEEENTDNIQELDLIIKYDYIDSLLQRVEEIKPEMNIIDFNELLAKIEDEIFIIHDFIRDKFSARFRDLESLVTDSVDYARIVGKIRNETDLTVVDLEGILPPAVIMAVTITASTAAGNPLSDDVLRRTVDACDRVIALDSAKRRVVELMESRMGSCAPNLSAVVGTSAAAKIVVAAGGLPALADKIPDGVRHLGRRRNDLVGFSTSQFRVRCGYLEETEIYESAPPPLRRRVCRVLAAKAVLAARVDCVGGDLSGGTGAGFRSEIEEKIEKWLKRPPARRRKPLPVPDLGCRKKRRGGRRRRKMKERNADVVEKVKLSNRVKFGVVEESSFGCGYGLKIGGGGGGGAVKRLKVGNGGGAISSLAFTPVEGLELLNPQGQPDIGSIQTRYFSKSGRFLVEGGKERIRMMWALHCI